ncbi:MAG: glyoxylate/hydroxypyruvate reductase A [Pseudomonadota bacterium]
MAQLIIGSERAEAFAKTARELAPDRDIRLWPDVGDPGAISAALAWGPPPGELAKFANLRLIVSVGAGVDHLFKDPDLPSAPIVRYVDPDLTGRMTEYVVLHTLTHSRRMLEFRDLQAARLWRFLPEPAASDVRVGIMGLGVLGQDAAEVLARIGYRVRGWSRSRKDIEGIECFAGEDERSDFLAGTDILVCLLPLTNDTRGTLNRALFAGLSTDGNRHERMPGPGLINAGRGGLQVETDILAALDDGTLYAASLDVFETEPLPKSSPLWAHPRVVVTPHNAAESKNESIVQYFLDRVEDLEAGRDLPNIVDRDRQY